MLKLLKRYISIALIIAVVFSSNVFMALADTVASATVSGSELTAINGETVTFQVDLSDNPGISAYHLKLTYDDDALELVADEDDEKVPYVERGSFTTKGTFMGSIKKNGVCEFIWFHTSNVSKDGSLFSVKFKVLNSALIGEYPIKISYISQDTQNIDEEPIALNCKDGSILVHEYSPSIIGEKAEANKGSYIDYSVSIQDNPGLDGYRIYLNYDKDALSLVLDEDDEIVYTVGESFQSGTIFCRKTNTGCQILWYTPKTVSDNGTLFTLRFHVNSSASCGKHEIALDYLKDDTVCNENPVSLKLQNGYIGIYHDCAGNYVAAKKPTCTESGNIAYYLCKECNKKFKSTDSLEEIENYTIQPLGHTEVIDKGYPATFSEFGKTDGSHCEVCGDIIEEQDDAYYYTDGSCDINNDGVLNAFELVAMRKALLGCDDYKALFFDANQDGVFDIRDLVRLKKLLVNDDYADDIARVKGEKLFAELSDFPDSITIADGVISDNNPELPKSVDGFNMDWDIQSVYYGIKDNKIYVKNSNNVCGEQISLSATVTFENGKTYTKLFSIKANVLRISEDSLEIHLDDKNIFSRKETVHFDYDIIPINIDGFSNPIKPIMNDFSYEVISTDKNGLPINSDLVLQKCNGGFKILDSAPIGSKIKIVFSFTHNENYSEKIATVCDYSFELEFTVVANSYKVSLVENGGTFKKSSTGETVHQFDCLEESLIFDGIVAEKSNYIFDGFYLDEDFNQKFCESDFENAIMASSDLVLYAKWIPDFFSIKFDANGGNVSESTKTVICNTPIGDLPIPTREGFSFGGWYSAEQGGTKFTNETIFSAANDITFYAHWTVNSYSATWSDGTGYTITVNRTSSPIKGAATGTIGSGTTVYYGDVLSVTYLAKTGYTIGSKGSTTIIVGDNISSSNIYCTATVNSYTATWSGGNGYTITVNRTSSPNKGASTGIIGSGTTVYYGDVLSITYTANTGYSISSKGVTSITVTGNVTSSNIYASASVNRYTYNILYRSSNGTDLGSSSATYDYGTTNTISPPTKDGYNKPGSQSIKWDSTSTKTIIFTYTPTEQPTRQVIATGRWWSSSQSKSTHLDYVVEAEWRNRTADSIEIRIIWTNTLTTGGAGRYGYKQEFEWWGWHQIASAADFSAAGGTRTASNTSGWHTYSCSPSENSRTVGSEWRDNDGKSGTWSGTVYFSKY